MDQPENINAFRSACDSADAICYFGIGALFYDCFQQLVLATGKPPTFLCDNAPGKHGQRHFGIPCISPTELAVRPRNTLIVVCVRNYEAICDQLHDQGFQNIFVAGFDRGYNLVGGIASSRFLTQSTPSPIPLLSIEDKWALVTGASRGIGRQIAEGLASLGANLLVHARQQDHLDEVTSACLSKGVLVRQIAGDLGDQVELESVLAAIDHFDHPIDIVFNNAGISPSYAQTFWDTPPDAFNAAFAVNSLAPIRLCQKLIPPMIKRGFGRVINVSTTIQNRPTEMAYACSKAALDKFVADIQPELAGTGVMMSLLDPGWLRTDMGGAVAPHGVESVLPGALIGAVADWEVGGHWFSAQDYVGLSLESAIKKAFALARCLGHLPPPATSLFT